MDIDFSALKPNSEIRAEARVDLSGNWVQPILACLLYSIVQSAAAGIAGIGNLIVGGPIELGLASYAVMFKRKQAPQLEEVFSGFRSFENSLVLYIIRTIIIALWSLLLIIPGIIAALKYSMSFYLLRDFPELTGQEAMRKSAEMTEGVRGKLFDFYIGFFGWAILCILTLGIGFLWLFPYIKVAEAGFYEDLKRAKGW